MALALTVVASCFVQAVVLPSWLVWLVWLSSEASAWDMAQSSSGSSGSGAGRFGRFGMAFTAVFRAVGHLRTSTCWPAVVVLAACSVLTVKASRSARSVPGKAVVLPSWLVWLVWPQFGHQVIDGLAGMSMEKSLTDGLV